MNALGKYLFTHPANYYNVCQAGGEEMTEVASAGPKGIVHMRNLGQGSGPGLPVTDILCGTVSEPEASTSEAAPDPWATAVHPGTEWPPVAKVSTHEPDLRALQGARVQLPPAPPSS